MPEPERFHVCVCWRKKAKFTSMYPLQGEKMGGWMARFDCACGRTWWQEWQDENNTGTTVECVMETRIDYKAGLLEAANRQKLIDELRQAWFERYIGYQSG